MAEMAVLHVASKILSAIASPAFEKAYEKACSIKEAREELVQLGVTLKTIRAVLLDAEKKEHDSAAIKDWIKRLRGVLYDAEDLVDEVATDDLRKQQRKKLPLKGRVKVFFSNSHISRNSIAEKVKAIRKSLLAKIREKLEGQKYLLVLDDVWEDKRSKWVDRMRLLRYGAEGSRIIVTTRLSSVKKAMDAVGTHTLKGLSDDDSWNLFKRLAFDAKCEVDPRKERLGREILKKCCGVPLAIQSIGNLLSHEYSLSKWEAIEREGLPKMGGDYDEIMSVLKLSYDHLPSNLKHCFAFCSLFPKDCNLFKEELMNHWNAQGYVEPDDAESAFMYLLRMGFFQEACDDIYGEIRSCKMHDIMHDLALYVAGEESVMLSSISPSNCARHVSVANSDIEKSFGHLTSMPNAKSLRSIILSKRCLEMVEKSDVFARFKYLRTLSLAYLNIENIPDSVGELKLMRYLNLKVTCIRKLPNTITNLVNLLSLDLQRCEHFEVWPLDFHKLVNLMYLNVQRCYNLMSMPVRIGGMTNLQHLSEFRTGNELNVSDGLPPQLRGKLSIWVGEESGVNLQSWQLPVSLQHLELVYWGAECEITKWLTNGIGSTNNLARLELRESVNIKYLPYLRFLPKLRWLQVLSLSELEFMEEEEGNNTTHNNNTATSAFFPCLEQLELIKLPELKGWWRKAAEVTSAFPLLRELTIKICPQLDLKSLPPSPGVRVLEANDWHMKMAAGGAATKFSSNPVSLGGLAKGKNVIIDTRPPKFNLGPLIKSMESCISHILDILLLLPIHRNFDEYTSIKLVFAHRLNIPWINKCKRQRIDVVEEAKMMPASSLTVLIIQDSKRIFQNLPELSTARDVICNHICSITVRPIPGQLSSTLEEFLQRLRWSNRQELQMVSRPKFTEDLLRTDFELFSQSYLGMRPKHFNAGASSSTTISRQPPSSS